MSRRARRPHFGMFATTPVPPIVRLWILRILVQLRGHAELLKSSGFSNDGVAAAAGLGEWVNRDDDDFDSKAVLQALRKLHAAAEQDARLTVGPALSANVARLAELVGLSDTDCRILEFVVALHSEPVLDDAADLLGVFSSSRLNHPLSVILALPESEVRRSLSKGGVLARSGLVSIDYNGVSPFKCKLELLSAGFAEHICTAETDPVTLLRDSISPGQAGQLSLADYPHIQPSLNLLLPYLRAALANNRPGANVLLYGSPGTGKTELVRALAADLRVELFEIAGEDAEGDPVHGGNRLRAYKVAQSIFSARRAMLVFDEAEDIFNDGDGLFGKRSTAQVRKAWLNRMLEQSPVPTVWISNSVSCIDPAFIRRFDVVLEVPVPPKQQRVRMLQQAGAELLDASTANRLAQCEALAPAVAARAAQVVRSVLHDIGPAAGPGAVELLINNTLEAQGHARLKKDDPTRLPDTYDPAFIRADADLLAVARGLRHAKSGRLCLYGPPGTGKTAYAHWLAEQLDVPLYVQRASDLLSKWVGDNEKNIARAFRAAEESGSVLLIDEVDGFLRDRRGADRGWEASLVNEMLTQMEAFSGVFIASTNLMDNLDQAALRRFDIKVKFDFLAADQAWHLLKVTCSALGIAAPPEALLTALAALTNLTPGDFAAVSRQHRFHVFADASSLVRALADESALKCQNRARPIGFVTDGSGTL